MELTTVIFQLGSFRPITTWHRINRDVPPKWTWLTVNSLAELTPRQHNEIYLHTTTRPFVTRDLFHRVVIFKHMTGNSPLLWDACTLNAFPSSQ